MHASRQDIKTKKRKSTEHHTLSTCTRLKTKMRTIIGKTLMPKLLSSIKIWLPRMRELDWPTSSASSNSKRLSSVWSEIFKRPFSKRIA